MILTLAILLLYTILPFLFHYPVKSDFSFQMFNDFLGLTLHFEPVRVNDTYFFEQFLLDSHYIKYCKIVEKKAGIRIPASINYGERAYVLTIFLHP